ncbi:MAG: Hsp20/alpha crystallin family protein [Oscillospiraceae bacterium]|nr:Hsp20/alpha crystallin family protein [Oscillospiraceae bacterium]
MFGMIPFDRSDNNLFDTFDSFARDFFRKSNADLPAFRTDIRDAGDSYVLEAELPGFNKEDINLDLKDGILTITAAHTESTEDKGDNGSYIRRERRYGSFQRSFDVTGIEETGITAAYLNGVLTLTLPKAKPAEPETRRIAIN